MDQELSQQSTSSQQIMAPKSSINKSFTPILLIGGLLFFLILATIVYYLTINKNVQTSYKPPRSTGSEESSTAIDAINKDTVNDMHAKIKQYYVENGSYPKSLNELTTLFKLEDQNLSTYSKPPYYFSSNGNAYEYYVKLKNGDIFKGDIKGINRHLDAQVQVNVNQISQAISLYYAETKRLPKALDDLASLSSLSFFKLRKNPITGKPYIYMQKDDRTGFTVIGMLSDGSDYKIELPIK